MKGILLAMGLALSPALVGGGAPVSARAAELAPQTLADSFLLHYKIKSGESLQLLARRGLIKAAHLRVAAVYNDVAIEAPLPEGALLTLRLGWLSWRLSAASVVSYVGDVQIIRNGRILPMRIDQSVREGDLVQIGKTGTLNLRLGDGRRISLPSLSRIRVAGLRHIILTDQVFTRFIPEQGMPPQVENLLPYAPLRQPVYLHSGKQIDGPLEYTLPYEAWPNPDDPDFQSELLSRPHRTLQKSPDKEQGAVSFLDGASDDVFWHWPIPARGS